MKEWLKKHGGLIVFIMIALISYGTGVIIGRMAQKTETFLEKQRLYDQIDSLQNQIHTLELRKDSIKTEIDSVYVEIEIIKEGHNEKVNTIISNDPSSNYKFFTDYLDANRSRLDSCISGRH